MRIQSGAWYRCPDAAALTAPIRPNLTPAIQQLAAEMRPAITAGSILDLACLWHHRGVAVIPEDTGTDAGMLVVGDVLSTIFVNRADPMARQRFTVAHEYFHLARHVPEFGRAAPADPWLNAQLEREANRFAAELLMPAAEVLRAWRGSRTPAGVAAALGVSTQAAAARLRHLGAA